MGSAALLTAFLLLWTFHLVGAFDTQRAQVEPSTRVLHPISEAELQVIPGDEKHLPHLIKMQLLH